MREDEECDAPQLGHAVLALALTAAEVVRRYDGRAVVGVAVQAREVLRAGESGRKTRKEGEGGGDEAGERQRASVRAAGGVRERTWWMALIGPKLRGEGRGGWRRASGASRQLRPASPRDRTLAPYRPTRAERDVPHHRGLGQVLARAAAVAENRLEVSELMRSGGTEREAARCSAEALRVADAPHADRAAVEEMRRAGETRGGRESASFAVTDLGSLGEVGSRWRCSSTALAEARSESLDEQGTR